MKNVPKTQRVVSGIIGFLFFLVANFTTFFQGLNVTAGILQVLINIYVFVVWAKAYPQCRGFEKFVTFFGVAVPPIMMGITIWRVLLPVMIN